MRKYSYKQLSGDDLISESYKQINENTEALLRNFEGDTYPEDPVKGQLCFVNDAWYTFDGAFWKAAPDLHHHDGRYYTKSQSFSKTELEQLLTGYQVKDHRHGVGDINDFPQSLPANGGQAETATKLAQPVMIGDQSFDGSTSIQLMRKDNVLFLTPTWTQSGTAYHATCGSNACGYGLWSLMIPAGGAWLYYDYGGKYMGITAGSSYLYYGLSTASTSYNRACQNPIPRKILCMRFY